MSLEQHVKHEMERHGCARLEKKCWSVPAERVAKGQRNPLGVGALILDKGGRALLVRHHPSTGWQDDWFTPGGIVEEGETVEEALKREIKEEVGLDVDIVELSKVNNEILVAGEEHADTYFFQFVVRLAGGEVSPREGEILEAKWFEDLPGNMAFREDYIDIFEGFRKTKKV